MTPHVRRIAPGRTLTVLVAAAALVLSACGGGDDAGDTAATTPRDTAAAPAASDGDDAASGDDSDAGSAEAPEPVLFLSHEATVPSGFRMTAATCLADGDSDETDSDSDDNGYDSWITFAVPQDAVAVGYGSAGSGGVTGTDEDLMFELANDDGTRLSVDMEWDARDQDGNLTTSMGEPWESFDYERTGDDGTKTITFDSVGTVQIGENEAEIFYLDPSQDPDWIDEQYKVRVEAFELPIRTHDGFKLMPYSFVATFWVDDETADFDQDLVETIAATFTMPECTWDEILTEHELMVGVDLNGDGHVRDAADLERELQEMLDEVQSNN